ncbi:MAG TPA: hypothetical protein VFB41_09000 [Solirubrobacteraceae bacterium]|nr:hypothetical protein [Solirubrobacteraceae bacterium]
MHTLPKRIATLAVTAAIAGTGATAIVAGATEGDAQIGVGPQVTLQAGETAPFDAAGVRAIRRGEPIPDGYVLVGRKVTIDRGTAGSVGAAFKLTCPGSTTARTLGLTGENGPSLIGSRYVGHRDVRVAVWSPPRAPRSTGMSYVVCR